MSSNELEIFKQSILDDVRVMMQTTGQVTQYIGARYVPLFAEPLDWSDQMEYEPLTIVLHQGNSFTSRQFVPRGIDISNTEFWANTGNYNAQIEQYRQEVQEFDGRITANEQAIAHIHKTYNSVADMQNDAQLAVGKIVSTLGFYNPKDNGGAKYEIVAEGTPMNGNVGDILPTRNGYAKLIPPTTLNVSALGATEDLADCTNILQKAVNLCKNVFIDVPIKVNGTVQLKLTTNKIMGSGKYTNPFIEVFDITSNSDKPVFQLKSLSSEISEYTTPTVIENISIKAKNALKFNEPDPITSNETKYTRIKGLIVNNCSFSGVYSTLTDSNKDSATVPSVTELENYGVAIYGSLLFDSCISNCYFEDYGIAIEFYSCDVNLIDNCRIVATARWFHNTSDSTFGGRNKIENCDLLTNKRIYGIYTNVETYILNNYFETYTQAGVYASVGNLCIISNNNITPNEASKQFEIRGTNGSFIGNHSAAGGFYTGWPKVEFTYENYNNFLGFAGYYASGNIAVLIPYSPIVTDKSLIVRNNITRENYFDLNEPGCFINIGGSGGNAFNFTHDNDGWHLKDSTYIMTLTLPYTGIASTYKVVPFFYENPATNDIYISVQKASIDLVHGYVHNTSNLTFTSDAKEVSFTITGTNLNKLRRIEIVPENA